MIVVVEIWKIDSKIVPKNAELAWISCVRKKNVRIFLKYGEQKKIACVHRKKVELEKNENRRKCTRIFRFQVKVRISFLYSVKKYLVKMSLKLETLLFSLQIKILFLVLNSFLLLLRWKSARRNPSFLYKYTKF